MPQLFTNNGYGSTSGAITNVATTINLATGNGARFPTPAGGDYFFATLIGLDSNGVENVWEIVKCTARAGDALTVVRAQDGTAAVAWSSGTRIENRPTAELMNALSTRTGAETLANKQITAPRYTIDNDGNVSGAWAIDYNNGPVIKATITGNITAITMNNWPASGIEGHLRLRLVNPGAAATWNFPTAWKFVKSDLTTTTTFADLSLTLPATGTVLFDLVSDDAGATVLVYIARN